MKRFPHLLVFSVVLLIIGGLMFTSLPRPVGRVVSAQELEPKPQAEPIVSQSVGFAATIPLRDMEVPTSRTKSHKFGKVETNTETPEKVTRKSADIEGDYDATLTEGARSASEEIQSNLLTTPQANFEGLSNIDNSVNPAILGFVFPPDTVGDVGPNHYVQATNLLFRVFSKAGAPLTPTQPISALFTAMGGRCATTNNGDPIVLYDSFADRWIITQFVVSGATPFGQCFAISQTPDPTGAYYTYDFVYPVNKFNDYPKFGVWPDGYYFTANQFNFAGTAFLGVGVGAFDREKVLRGDPTAGQIFFDLETTFPNAASMLPSDADGLTPPPANAPNIVSYFGANEFGDPEGDALIFFAFDANFANPMASTFTSVGNIPVAAFNPLTPPGRDDIEQPAPAAATAALDSIGDRLMHRLQYRIIGNEEVLTTNHTVNAGTGTTLATYRAGVRYYELRRPTGNTGLFTIRNQQTYAPAADTHERWMASAATDNQGNLALGYSIVNGSAATPLFPGINYAGRLVNDPADTLPQAEQTLQLGTGVQTNTGSRWGDYSALTVDPNDDCTFFYTQEYYQTTDPTPADAPFGVNWQTRVGSFRFTECTAPPKGTLTVNVTNCETGLPIQGASVTIDGNLYGSTLAGGSYSTQLSPGSYTVSVTAPNFLTATGTATVTNGGTTTLNLCIQGVPAPVAGAATLVNESCSPDNNAVDPGERVTVSLAVTNAGADDTTNLIGTLQSSANVIAPSGPQSYGAIPPGGTASRTFSFTANGNCGDTITLNLQLQDGASNFGTVSYTLTLGNTVTSSPTTFSNSTTISIPAGAPTTTSGPASPYPSNIAVAGLTGTVNKVTVALNGLGHTFPDDVDVLLVSPSGQKVVIMSDAGGGTDVIGVTLTLDDAAATALPDSATLTTGTFRPANYAPSETFPAPAPGPPYAATSALSNFNGTNPNGTWSLYVFDDVGGDVGSFAGGWSLTLTTAQPVCNTTCNIVRLVTTTSLTRSGSDVVATVNVQNQGVVTVNNVALTQASLGAVNGTPIPQTVSPSTLAAGQTGTATVTFANPGSAGQTRLLRLRGTYTGGTFSRSQNVTLP